NRSEAGPEHSFWHPTGGTPPVSGPAGHESASVGPRHRPEDGRKDGRGPPGEGPQDGIQVGLAAPGETPPGGSGRRCDFGPVKFGVQEGPGRKSGGDCFPARSGFKLGKSPEGGP